MTREAARGKDKQRRGAAFNVRIESIAAGGAGVSHLPDGRAVFVQRSAPGDLAAIELIREKPRWAAARLVKLLEPGPSRRVAPCPHYARCGGCTLEHIEYSAQLAAKANIVQQAMRRIGAVAAEVPGITPSPNEFRYRNRISFTLVRTPTGNVIAGFHEIDRPDHVVDISADCLLPEEPIALVWKQLRLNWGSSAALLPSGPELRLTLRANARGDVGLIIDGGYSAGQPDRLRELVPELQSIWHRSRGAAQHVLLSGDDAFAEIWQEEDLSISGAMFLQVNRAVAEQLEQHVLARAQSYGSQRAVDAYCGLGLHARRLARLGCSVVGIELDAAAIAEAERNAPPGASFVRGRVEDVLADYLPVDLVIVNPPRAGLAEPVAAILHDAPPAHLIYVSCDPATLARDLARLAPVLQLEAVRCFDLFPQTTHVETVAELACATS
jgi:23S rRNA (uracil1939-C5)-methyltransferase